MDMEHYNDCVKTKKKPSSSEEVQNSLRQEIIQLEKRLQDQVAVRCALEKALGCGSSSHKPTCESPPINKPTRELIREISVLEFEVGHLEQYLLSLYRKAFDQQLTSFSPPRRAERLKSHLGAPRRRIDFSKADVSLRTGLSACNAQKESNPIAEEKKSDFRVQRSHSSLSVRSARPNRAFTQDEAPGKTVRACYSQPLSMREYEQSTSSKVSCLGRNIATHSTTDLAPTTPNKLSEEMIKCMCTIYCRLSDRALTTSRLGASSPTTSAFSSPNPYSQSDTWSPRLRNDSSFDLRLDNPFHVQGLKDFSGPYSTMVEIQCIHRDSRRLCKIEPLLQYYRSLICQLDETDPSLLTHEEKLAFWINIHNALVMHAFLAYGIPQNSMKRTFILLKAAYNVGGHIVSADAIETSILRCRMPRSGQWIRFLVSSWGKFKTGDERQAFVIERPEPLLHFALSSGNHSDPAVRLYTPKKVVQELEAAKEEYTRATFGVSKDHKIVLPKVVESFAKDSGMCAANVVEMVHQSLPDSLRRKSSIIFKKRFQRGKGRRNIEWVPHDFTFRYLIYKDLVR
ncbi:unnamed protein product [Cuscuta europaea]|uniref:DUF547 domain-containing protein n=1 Tax=Cuscuta europaea TaxID=41803 RepID=A0A9P0YNA0_CUSEU|nr:unnamed protein product [Cuscuta europaea]